jgi:hypothetical protein
VITAPIGQPALCDQLPHETLSTVKAAKQQLRTIARQ